MALGKSIKGVQAKKRRSIPCLIFNLLIFEELTVLIHLWIHGYWNLLLKVLHRSFLYIFHFSYCPIHSVLSVLIIYVSIFLRYGTSSKMYSLIIVRLFFLTTQAPNRNVRIKVGNLGSGTIHWNIVDYSVNHSLAWNKNHVHPTFL